MPKLSVKITSAFLLGFVALLPQTAYAEFNFKFLKCEQTMEKFAHISWEMDNKTDTFFTNAMFSLDMLDIDNAFIQQTNIYEQNLRPQKKARARLLYQGKCAEISTIEVSGSDGFATKRGYIYYGSSYNKQYAKDFRDKFDKTISISAYGNVNAVWVSR